jgi:type IV secretory pathway VirD2 relaxase
MKMLPRPALWDADRDHGGVVFEQDAIIDQNSSSSSELSKEQSTDGHVTQASRAAGDQETEQPLKLFPAKTSGLDESFAMSARGQFYCAIRCGLSQRSALSP